MPPEYEIFQELGLIKVGITAESNNLGDLAPFKL